MVNADVNGERLADIAIRVDGLTSLSAVDFIL